VDTGPLTASDSMLWILEHREYRTVCCGYWATDSIGQYVVDIGSLTVSDSMLWILGTDSIGQYVVDTGPLTVSDNMLWMLEYRSIGQYVVDTGPLTGLETSLNSKQKVLYQEGCRSVNSVQCRWASVAHG